jgi:hypothetical protein
MNAVLFAVAEDVKLNPLPSAGVDGLTIGGKINGDLNDTRSSFDHFVGAGKKGWMCGEAKCLGGLEVET